MPDNFDALLDKPGPTRPQVRDEKRFSENLGNDHVEQTRPTKGGPPGDLDNLYEPAKSTNQSVPPDWSKPTVRVGDIELDRNNGMITNIHKIDQNGERVNPKLENPVPVESPNKVPTAPTKQPVF